MKQKIFFFLIFCKAILFAQQKQAKEFSILTDNDLYISLEQDRYYTNGIFLKYRYLAKKWSKNIDKKIIEIQVGNQMYTPFKASVEHPKNHDRPFAGYSFGSFGVSKFYKDNSLLKTTLQIGILGAASKSKELQSFIHNLYGYKKITGWKYQIKNTVGINLKIAHIKSLSKETFADINWINSFNIGTIHTNLATGFYGRLSLKPLEKITNSIAFNANLNNEKTTYTNKIESFVYIKPMLHYIAYDATIKGGFLSDNKSPITYQIIPFKVSTEIGIRFTAKQYNFGYAINYHSKKLKSARVPDYNFYGTLQFNYVFN
ncbi:lipid A deacylase LpxR family protein [Tenacibaculum dicentrarchi]|nr:lipid A deacylase LpxR family protein [Tenacibaculum dicentrarchi]MCD8425520.1 lipid A deacylase LpxR family protein [Tenacibaculum dicentrarchi]MCD8442804.1 lipid A deacylase LpxR family protein [Tenacibaculum dicentrarchi]